MKDILDLDLEGVLNLGVEDIGKLRLNFDGFEHISRSVGALWVYDYEAAARGKVGMHAELKSKAP